MLSDTPRGLSAWVGEAEGPCLPMVLVLPAQPWFAGQGEDKSHAAATVSTDLYQALPKDDAQRAPRRSPKAKRCLGCVRHSWDCCKHDGHWRW